MLGIESVALLKGADQDAARTLLFDLADHSGAKHQKKPQRDRKRAGETQGNRRVYRTCFLDRETKAASF
jgi:hypothetical protein